MRINNETIFINEKHKDNYKELRRKYKEKSANEYEIILRLLAIDFVYHIAKDYINSVTIDFMEMFRDPRLSSKGLCVCKVAYSLFSEYYLMNLSSISKLEIQERKYILDCIYIYEDDIKGA